MNTEKSREMAKTSVKIAENPLQFKDFGVTMNTINEYVTSWEWARAHSHCVLRDFFARKRRCAHDKERTVRTEG